MENSKLERKITKYEEAIKNDLRSFLRESKVEKECIFK